MLIRVSIAVVLGGLLILIAAWGTSALPHYVNDCTYDQEAHAKKCAPNHIVLVALRRISEFIEDYDKIIVALTGAAVAAFTGTLWWSTRKLWRVTNATLQHSERTAERQLRAYVYLEVTGRAYPPAPKTPDRYSVLLMIRNSGATWARNVRVRHVMGVDPEQDDPFAAVKWDEIKPHPILIGPGQETSMQFGDLSGADLRDIIENKRRVFFMAWITYEDILASPPIVRQTQLFRRFNADEEGGVSFAWMPIHNCADEDCEKQN
jgi:hypothetical protein